MPFTLFFVVFVLSIVTYLFTTTRRHLDLHWKLQNVPYEPRAIPLFGHILSLFTLQDNFGTLLEKFYKRMGRASMYGCFVMQRPSVLLRDPALIKSVLQTNFTSFHNNLVSLHEDLDPILSKNPFFAKNETWEKSRVLLANNLSGRKLRCLLVFVNHACDKLKLYVDSKIQNSVSEDLELRFLFSRAIAEVIANAAFQIEGRNFEETLDHNAFINIPEKVFNLDKLRAVQQIIRFFLPNVANLLRVSLTTNDVNRFIKRHLGDVMRTQQQSNSDYLQFSPKDVGEVNEDLIMAQATAILFDGYEAIGSTLCFMFYRLSQNLDIQKRARQEVLRVLEKYDGQCSYEAFKEMTYLDQIINEVLRMNPLFGDITRVCNQEITLCGNDGLTCRLKPGDMILISATGLHYDPDFWPDPGVFDPDRFDSGVKRDKYTFFGFSNGARMCPGRRMGLMVVKAVAATVLRNYSTVISSRMDGPLRLNKNTFASSVEGGVWVNFKSL